MTDEEVVEIIADLQGLGTDTAMVWTNAGRTSFS